MIIRGITLITILFVSGIILNFTPLTFASIPEQENIEATKAMMAAEQSVGKKLGRYLLTDQDGKRFSLKDLYDRPLIVSFIYTSCPHTCSTITAHLATALKEVGNPPERFNVMTIGFDYERDTPERMREFGKRFTDDFSHWKFVTADRDTLEKLSRDIGFYYSKRGDGFNHLDMISIIAPGGEIYQQIYGANVGGREIGTPLRELLTNRREEKRPANPIGWRDRLITMCSLYDESTQTYRINYVSMIRIFLEVMSPIVTVIFMWRSEAYSLVKRVVPN